ncbi:sensor histidine kinase [Desemzia sp. RIT804]|uniref:sensor histidine kinase n=1 Tax=Desemzia sp. RIT 804 TaxID=2810209 RepID=UPI00194E5E35|nr:sensor histidine kinase [Desemzia sp. RIT 804]MBM6613786.1 sensor histidine kinase [Desemzia sp. RIT 804]
MFSLFILMLERGGLIIILAYLLINIPYFKNVLTNRHKWDAKIKLIVIFSLFALISNYTGVEINQDEMIVNQFVTQLSSNSALANTRVLTIGVSGLIGGSSVGIIVGLVSAIVRFFQGGGDVHIYVLSSILIGLFSGYFGNKSIQKNTYPTAFEGLALGFLMEAIQMVCIFIFGNSYAESWSLIQFIALPMMLTNCIGTGIFLSIIETTLRQEEQTKAVQTHDVLQLANQTMPYFRSGLNERSCEKAAQTIQQFIKVDAVSITNQERILAHVGAASDHHIPSIEILTDLSKKVLRTGKISEAHSREEIGCNHNGCPLEAAIVIPLKSKQKTIGTLKMYFTDKSKLTFVERQLAEGLGNIFSQQIELGEVEWQSKLLQDAEIKSLQSQVNPHFFFNTLNTISALIRIDSEKARSLLIQLSNFFRSNLTGARTNLIPLTKELEQVNAFQTLEEARFPGRYHLTVQYDKKLEQVLLPPFLIQVLVENAYRHAFKGRKKGNQVVVSIRNSGDAIHISVQDNGVGIEPDVLTRLGKEIVFSEKGSGSAVENLNKRLLSLFGESAQLQFDSTPEGTTVSCVISHTKIEEEKDAYTNRR